VSFWPSGFTSADRAVLNGLAATMKTVTQQLGKVIVSQDALNTDVQTIEAGVAALGTAAAAIQAEIAALKAANPALDLTGLDKAAADLTGAVSTVAALAPPAA
jgi:hypothetical protein